ncbi:MAG: crotonase/enoyl-CoA hydratase family protein [Alphaproteobacteria bacterium]|jgi:enoyl-CoA hydratase|nr:crotonase/enoyl-CoA hydratase family protein [Alphaproteobacteria bacterium]
MSQFESIQFAREQGRVRITLNRPEKLNALTLKMQMELSAALWEADNDRDVHCVILAGAGRSFCAGYDLTGEDADVPVSPAEDRERRRYRGATSLDDDAWQLERAQRYRMTLFDMHKPVIAEVHGHCLAGGSDLALMCDMVVAADDAVFGFPPARDLGALPNQFWVYHCGPQWAKRLMLSGDTVTGAEAAEIGLVMKSVPPADLTAECEGLAGRLAMIDPDLLSANKRIVNMALELMGARTLQRMAAENDVRGHNTPAARAFRKSVRDNGLKATLKGRDAKFGDGRARVRGPERRDPNGWLID